MEGGWGKGGGITPFNGLHCIQVGSAHLYVSGILMGRNFAKFKYCDNCIPGPETETLAQIRQIHIKRPRCLLQNNDNLYAREW